MNTTTLTINHTTKTYPRLPYQAILEAILGTSYSLSLVFIGDTRARTLNQQNRSKDYIPDVLSFPLTTQAGEIFLCLPAIKRSHAKYQRNYRQQVGFLFIHGLLHLKGYSHGATMERAEKKYCQQFSIC